MHRNRQAGTITFLTKLINSEPLLFCLFVCVFVYFVWILLHEGDREEHELNKEDLLGHHLVLHCLIMTVNGHMQN